MRTLVCSVSGQGRAYRAHLHIGGLANPTGLGVRDRAWLKSMPANDSAAS
jgi:hypothetical protein